MEPPTRGLQTIFDKHPKDVEETKISFLNEDTLVGKTVLLPQTVTIQDLKEQVRQDNKFPIDAKCENGHGLKLIYPKDGIEMAAASYIGSPGKPRRTKKKSHKNCVDLNDQARWNAMTKHWDEGTAHRRDISLVKYSNEVANIIGSKAPASVTLEAAKRLCCIIGVPHNVTSLKRLKRNYIIFQAVDDLIKYRDPHVSKITDNCEPLSIACGVHLHWFLSQTSQAYRNQRTDGHVAEGDDDGTKAESDDGVGVPPEYEKYLRLNKMGQSVKATMKQMLAEHLDPSVIGLCKPESEEEKRKKEAEKEANKFEFHYGEGSSDEEDELDDVSFDAPTTEALLLALRKVTGAIRYRQYKILLQDQLIKTGEKGNSFALITDAILQQDKQQGGLIQDNNIPPPSPEPSQDNQTNNSSIELDNNKGSIVGDDGSMIDDETITSNNKNKGILKDQNAGSGENSKNVVVVDVGEEVVPGGGSVTRGGQTNDVDSVITGDLDQNMATFISSTRPFKNSKSGDVCHGEQQSNGEDPEKVSYPWLEHIDEFMHKDWEMCSAEALDVTAYLCLGALWCNLEKNEDAVWCHGEEVLSYALLLSIHGGATNFENYHKYSDSNLNAVDGSSKKKTATGTTATATGTVNKNKSASGDNKNITGFKNEKKYIVEMQCIATHFACFLLTMEPGLKKFLAAQSSLPQTQIALTSFSSAVSVTLENPKNNIINFANSTENMNVTLILPGLSELTLVNNRKIALSCATMVASVVSSSELRASIGRQSAQLSLPTILTYALKVLFQRTKFRKNQKKQKLKNIKEDDQADNHHEEDFDEVLEHVEVEGFSSEILSCLRGKTGHNAASIFDHALVAVWGLLHVLYSRRSNGSIEDHCVLSPSRRNRNHRHRLKQKQIRTSKNFNNGSSIGNGSSHGINRSNSHHTTSKVFDQISKQQQNNVEDKILPKESALFEMANSPHLPHCHAATAFASYQMDDDDDNENKGTSNNKMKSPNYKQRNRTQQQNMNNGGVTKDNKTRSLASGGGGGGFDVLLDDEGRIVPATLVERVLLLCSWNNDTIMNQIMGDSNQSNPKSGIGGFASSFKVGAASNNQNDNVSPPSECAVNEEEEGEGEEGDDTFDANSTVGDSLPSNSIVNNNDSDSTSGINNNFNKDDKNNGGSGGGVGEGINNQSFSSFKSPSLLPQQPIIHQNHKQRPRGSGGSGYGPLSEVELRSSLGCLSLISAVKCVETTALLKVDGLVRILQFAEMGPDQGVSEEVQEVAFAALAHLCSSADIKHLKLFDPKTTNPPSPTTVPSPSSLSQHNSPGNKTGFSLKHRISLRLQKNQTFKNAGNTPGSVIRDAFGDEKRETRKGNKVLFKAWAALKSFVSDHSAIERLAQLRQIVTAKARQGHRPAGGNHGTTPTKKGSSGGSVGSSSGGGGIHGLKAVDPLERERIKQRRWDMVKAVAVSIMHLSGLEQTASKAGMIDTAIGLSIDDIGSVEMEPITPVEPVGESSGGIAAVSSEPPSSSEPHGHSSHSAISVFSNIVDKEKKELSPEEKKEAEKEAAMEQRANALATVMVAAQARSLFARRRLECVCQQLWGDNKTIVTEACASVWLLGRSLVVRAALSRLCVDGRNKETGKIVGRHFPMISRLIECASGNGDDILRAWALASITTLCSDPSFQKKHALEVIPCLVSTLITYCDEGDPKIKRKLERKEKRKKNAQQLKQQRGGLKGKTTGGLSFDILPTKVNYVIGYASSTSAALAQEVSLQRQKLAALSVSALLLLAYFHPPSLEMLQNLLPTPDNRNHGFGGIEYSLYKMCKRKDLCRRVKKNAGHLLFILCTKDMDDILSHCRKPPKSSGGSTSNYTNASSGFYDTSIGQGGGQGGGGHGSIKRSHLIMPQHAGPLWRLNASAHRNHSNNSSEPIEEGTVLEELFLHLLYEETCQEYDLYEPQIVDEDGDPESASVQLKQQQQQQQQQQVGGGIGIGGSGNDTMQSPASISNIGQQKIQKDPTIPQAIEYGFLDGGDGDEFGVEKDALMRLCLHALTDLCARRDIAKAVVVENGGANLASKLIREARIENKIKYHMNMEKKFGLDGAVLIDDDDEEIEAGSGNSAKEEWKIIMPLHLFLNCSTCEKAQPRLCAVALDDLIRATMTLAGTHGAATLEVQLAYAALANISRNAICRSSIYKHSLASGILPPGARDWTKGQQLKQQQSDKLNVATTKQKNRNNNRNNNNNNDYEEEKISNERPVGWEYPGMHPLYHMVQHKNSLRHTLISAPNKESKSLGPSFGSSMKSDRHQTKEQIENNKLSNQVQQFKNTHLASTSNNNNNNRSSQFGNMTSRPRTAPGLSSSSLKEIEEEGDNMKQNSNHLSSFPSGSLMTHTANHPSCSSKSAFFENIHPSAGTYRLATTTQEQQQLLSSSRNNNNNNNNSNIEISNVLKDGDLLSSLGFSTGHFGGTTMITSHGTSGQVDFDDEFTLSEHHPFPNHYNNSDISDDSDSDDNDDNDDNDGNKKNNNNAMKLEQIAKDEKIGQHVASVQSWMFSSTMAQPPKGAPKINHIVTNAPIVLPDPAGDAAHFIASNHPAAPLIASKTKNKERKKSVPFSLEPSNSPPPFWQNDEFKPPGASTTRTRTCEGVSSMIPQNVSFPYGADHWHPDIVDCHAERKEWIHSEGGLSKADTLAGIAVASAYKNKAKARSIKAAASPKRKSFSAKPSSGGGSRRPTFPGVGDSLDSGSLEDTGGIASTMAKHKLKVLKKVMESENAEIAANEKSGNETISGNAVGTISLTVNPNICRGNHFTFPANKERPPAPVSPTKSFKHNTSTPTVNLPSLNGDDGGGSKSLLSINSNSPPSIEHQQGMDNNNNSVISGSHMSIEHHPLDHSNQLNNNTTVPLTRIKKKAVKSALAQLSNKTKNSSSSNKNNNQHISNSNNSNSNNNQDVIYPEFENVLNRGPMTASERRTQKLRAASAFAAAGATRITKPRTDVAKVWMWEHVEGSQVSQQAGLIPYQLPVHAPLAHKQGAYVSDGSTVTYGSKESGGNANAGNDIGSSNKGSPNKGGFGAFPEAIGAAIASHTSSTSPPHVAFKDEKVKEKFRNSIRIHTAHSRAKGTLASASRIVTAPFFFHLKTNPASPFPPPPLPPPPAPNSRCDIFQRYLPTIENGTSADGASGGPESQVIGEWAKLNPGPMKTVMMPPSMPGPYRNIPTMYDPEASKEFLISPGNSPQMGIDNVNGDINLISSPSSPKRSLQKSSSVSVSFVDNDNSLEESEQQNGNDGVVAVDNQEGGEGGEEDGKEDNNQDLEPSSDPPPMSGLKKILSSKSVDMDSQTAGETIDDTRLAWLHAPRIFDPLVNVTVGDHFVCGGMPLKNLSLLVRAPKLAPPPKPAAPPAPKLRGPPWDYKVSSIFVPRRTTTDAKSMVDICHQRSNDNDNEKQPKEKVKRAKQKIKRSGPFDHDWMKCLAKQDRFLNLIKKGVTTNDHPEVLAVAEVLKLHYDWLMYIFLIYAASDIGATDASSMGWMSYGSLMVASGIQDSTSKGCKEADLDTIFKAANFEAKGSDPNDENPLDALTRQEWLEIVIRVAKAKYGTADNKNEQLSVHIEKLIILMKEKLSEAAEANEDEAAINDIRHEWRLKYFYVEDTDKIYREYEFKLEMLYKSKIDFKDVGHHHLWSLSMWHSLMDSADFYLDHSFTREDGNLCFYFSKFMVYDYVKDGDGNACMDWLSFLEAIGHVSRIKDLPSQAVLSANNFMNICELMDRLELLNLTLDDFMAEHPPKHGHEDPFHIKLESCILLMFYTLEKKAAAQKASAAAAKLALAKAAVGNGNSADK